MSEINVDPMKKSSIYATFGRYYGEKLYKLLYDCCSGRPGSFCYEVLSCLGISSQGDSSKFLNQQGNWEYVSGSEPIEVIYTELINLISTNSLIPGKQYLITDFKTVHYIQFSGGGIGSEDIHTGTTEPMVVQAVSNSELAAEIWSTVYPEDEITWKPIFVDREWDAVAGQSTGIITYREDTINKNSRDFDFRNIVFRRWETVNGSGNYDSLTNTGFGFQDFSPFPVNSFSNYIGSPLTAAPLIGIPYYLDNNITQLSCFNNFIDISFGNTFQSNAFFNIVNILYGNLVGGDFAFNSSSIIFGNEISNNFQNNNTQTISLNTVTNLEQNNCRAILQNVFDGDIIKNCCNEINQNTTSVVGAVIEQNEVNMIYSNTDFVLINRNVGALIDGNDNCRIEQNSVNAISNNVNCEIKFNNMYDISSNTITAGQTIEISRNSGYLITQNTSTSATGLAITFNSVNSIQNNSFKDIVSVDNNKGVILTNNVFNGIAGSKFSTNGFVVLLGNTINASGIESNEFLVKISSKTFTPTAGMASVNPSITLRDSVAGDVEQLLAAGVLSYVPF